MQDPFSDSHMLISDLLHLQFTLIKSKKLTSTFWALNLSRLVT